MSDKGEQQIKSKERVSDHGEVFTAEREVNAMLDLVKDETERIDSRFLEPACGTGNFLTKILERKMAVVRSRYSKDLTGYELNALIAVSSIYGIDILMDNVHECRERLFDQFKAEYENCFTDKDRLN
jgi:type I restriction-modification system DNA methylase subunit